MPDQRLPMPSRRALTELSIDVLKSEIFPRSVVKIEVVFDTAVFHRLFHVFVNDVFSPDTQFRTLVLALPSAVRSPFQNDDHRSEAAFHRAFQRSTMPCFSWVKISFA